MPRQRMALGIKSHTGWAAVVAVSGPLAAAQVVAKRRIDMATTFEEGAVYHKAQELSLEQAEALVRSSEEKFERIAREALEKLLAELRTSGNESIDLGLVSGNQKELPPLSSIQKSHALVHAAEGDLYRRVVVRAAEAVRIRAVLTPERELESRAADALGVDRSKLAARLAMLGKASGRPWARDQKESAMAALIALAVR